ncbi:MAG TPA: redoxin domain-containing protein [bacterium]|nr:redoxin domain-containing protein [bacterium]
MRNRFLVYLLAVGVAISYAAGTAYAAGKKEKPVIKEAPKLPRSGPWLNPPSDIGKIYDGKITLVYFWDYTSINSIRELGNLKEWYQTYHPYGFEVVMIHAPEFDFAKEKVNVEAAVKRLGISFPVFLDNSFKVWDKFQTKSWPTKYLVDPKGMILHTQVGEEGNVQFEKKIREAIKKLIPAAGLPEFRDTKEEDRFNSKKCGEMSSETYVGYERVNWWGGEIATKKGVLPDKTLDYRDRGQRVERGFFVNGLWTNQKDDFLHARDTDNLADYMGILYLGHEVYAVMNRSKGTEKPRVYVTRDDEPIPPDQRGSDIIEDLGGGTYVSVDMPRLYYLIVNEDDEAHELKLWVQKKGLAVNSFSFSNRCLSQFDHL